jgi:hypothetical protein
MVPHPPDPPGSDPFDAVIPEPINAFFFDVLVNNENAKDWREFDQRTLPRLLTVCSLVLSVAI